MSTETQATYDELQAALHAEREARATAEQERDTLSRAIDNLLSRDAIFEAGLAALGHVEAIDESRVQVVDAAVPMLSRLLLVMLIKGDGDLYNYIEWNCGELPSTGPLTLSLQRGNGKTPAALISEARAERDAAIAELHELATSVVEVLEEDMIGDEDEGPVSEIGALYQAAFHILHRDDPPEVQ